MDAGDLRIRWIWIGSSAVGFLAGSIIAAALLPVPPFDPAALETIGNRYDLREGIYALLVGIPFAVIQWLVLRYALSVYGAPGKARSVFWVPVTGIGVAAIVFLTPSLDLSFTLSRLIILTLPPIVALSVAQWLLLRLLINAGLRWALYTAAGAAAGVYVATMAAPVTGLAVWALLFGACIGAFQALVLTQQLTIGATRREPLKRNRHRLAETITAIALALIMLVVIAPGLLQPDFRSVNSVEYSPDGKRIAADVENFVYLWEAETGKLIFAIDSGSGMRIWNPGDDLTFSADGSHIAFSTHDGGAIIVDSKTGERLLTISDYLSAQGVGDIAYSADSKQVLVTLSDGNVALYDANTGLLLDNYQTTIQSEINAPIVQSAAISPDGRKLAAGGNYWPRRGPSEGFAAVWDADSRQQLFAITGPATPVWHLVFSPDNAKIMTVDNESARVWNAHDGASITMLRPDCSGIVDAVFLQNGNQVALGCDNGLVHRCDTATDQCSPIFSQPLSDYDSVISIDFHPDNDQIVTATLGGVVATWDMRTGKRLRKFRMPGVD